MTVAPEPNDLLDAARAWYDAGYCVIPSHEDGGKRPFGAWKQYQTQRPQWDQVNAWLASGRYTGIGVLTGATSGNAEMLELEGPNDAALVRLNKVVAKANECAEVGVDALLLRVASGCVENSAGGGLHLFIRVTDGPALGNTKLAHDATGKVVAETRGEGGFVVVAPTTARKGHEPGATYMFVNGGHPANTVTVTSEERDLLHLLFVQALDETPDTPPPAEPTTPRDPYTGLSAFDDYRARVMWRDILEPRGWTHSHHADGRDHWTRPGKALHDGTSATTIEDGPLYCFSTSTPLPAEQGLSKGQVYAILEHGGDTSAAARALIDQGFGDGITYTDLPPWTVPNTDASANHDEQLPDDDPYLQAVRRKFAELRVLDDARTMLATSKAGDPPALHGIDLRTFLSQADAQVEYRIEELWPAHGRVLLAAAAKSGKTTIVAANILPSLVDGRPFLGRYAASPIDGTVVVLNMEVGENVMRRWMRDAAAQAAERIIIANLRGKATSVGIGTPAGRKRFATWLTDHGASCVILDPLAPLLASLGLDENSNTDVATFFSWWGETLDLAGVTDDLVTHHTGHAGQRSRGASRLLDEPDAIWTLTRESDESTGEFSRIDPVRYLSAFGRDVDLAPEALSYDASTRSLALTGMGKAEMRGDRDAQVILKVFSDGVPRGIRRMALDSQFGESKGKAVARRLVNEGVLESVGRAHGADIYLPTDVLEGRSAHG